MLTDYMPANMPNVYMVMGTIAFFGFLLFMRLQKNTALHNDAWWPKGYKVGEVYITVIGGLTVFLDIVMIGGPTSADAKSLVFFSAGLILGYAFKAVTLSYDKRRRAEALQGE